MSSSSPPAKRTRRCIAQKQMDKADTAMLDVPKTRVKEIKTPKATRKPAKEKTRGKPLKMELYVELFV